MSIVIEASVLKNINFAACHQGSKIIPSIEIKGEKGQNLIVYVRAVPAFFAEYKENILLKNGKHRLDNVPVHLDDAFYRREVIEAREATIQIEVADVNEPEKVLAFKYISVHLQPYLHWNRTEWEGSMTAFVQPNDPLVARVLNRAGEIANEESGRLVGYQNWPNSSAAKQAEWIYRALQEENIHYICPPAGFEFGKAGQKIRIPGMILHDEVKQGTCLDLAVLYVSCLEAASLNPILFLIHGHAFAGVWLEDNKVLNGYPFRHWETIYKETNSDTGMILPVECTVFTDGLNVPFENAVQAGKNHFVDKAKFHCALDVCEGRLKGYVPAYTFTDQPICDSNMELGYDMQPSTYGSTKMERLLKQAMDFSLKNALLSKAALNEEISFGIHTYNFFVSGYSEGALFEMAQKDVSEKALQNTLDSFHGIQRQELLDSGRNSLYLAVNELEWLPKNKTEKQKAPLYLCPAEVYRNMRGEYRFRVNKEACFFNPVLKDYLYQEFGLDVSTVSNHPYLEYDEQMNRLKYIVEKQADWQIVEDICGLGVYRIPNAAIWKGLQDEALLEHDIVHGMLNGKMTWKNDIENVDEDVDDPYKVYAYEADGSQSRVIASTFKKRAQVIIGPAGNGKSQTIANIIAEHMRLGKSVLFVTEKPAAMQVVADMLDRAKLTPFYFMLPDGKDSVAGLHEKVDETLRFIAKAHREAKPVTEQEKRYRHALERLRGFHAFMQKKDAHGNTLFELLENHGAYSKAEDDQIWSLAGEALNHEEARTVLEVFSKLLKDHPEANRAYLPYLNLQVFTAEADHAVDLALDLFNGLWSNMENFLYAIGNIRMLAKNKESMKQVLSLAAALKKCPVYGDGFDVPTKAKDEIEDELMRLTREMMGSIPGSYRYEDVSGKVWGKVDEGLCNTPGLEELASLQSFAMSSPLGGLSKEQMRMLQQKKAYKEYVETLLKLRPEATVEEKEALENATAQIVLGKGSEILERIDRLNRTYNAYVDAQKRAEALVVLDSDAFVLAYPDVLKADLLKEWKNCHENYSVEGQFYVSNDNLAKEIGLGGVVRRLEEKIRKGEMTWEEVVPAYIKARSRYNIEKICRENPEWVQFANMDYAISQKEYRENEKIVREYSRDHLIDCVMKYMPNLEEGSPDDSELGILQRLIRRNSKQTSPYKLFEEAPNALKQLFPCMMMGPETVAECLTSKGISFDIVIFDEASQLPSYKALIPISKGEKCLFIGDEKQLTPTTFFKKNILDVDGVETPQEAILEDAIVTSMPQKLLRYHYRSHYESLVAFSNNRYYHGEIVTFPGCDTHVKGVESIFVEDGCYDRGGARNNQKEAERVLALIGEIYAELPEDTTETLGVITFNLEQMKLIRSMIHQAICQNHPQRHIMENLVDVVNLEACQGKEWDRTIVSTAYGPDADGNFSSNLGPMTRDDGGNRLNVMITRSRKHLYVVTSMTPEMFGEATKAGTRDLKDFLAFAKGDLILDSRVIGADKDSKGMEAAIVQHLENKGYTVHTHIGSSTCKVDIGVVAEDGISYRLGILLDHFDDADYNVRDHEILIPGLLESKGWKLYRLHAMNWYANAARELEQIEKMLKA